MLTDTNNFTEISHPLDKDLRDDAAFERSTIVRFRNANLSLKELEIAGLALIGYDYNERYRYAVVEAKPCDPNILGMISDLVLEVDSVDTCLVYSILPFGVKLSVRSCIKEVKASELAEFITEGIGSGGGHLEKAGGFIQMELLNKKYPEVEEIKSFFKQCMNSYFADTEIIYAREYIIDVSDMELYKKQKIKIGYVRGKQNLNAVMNVRRNRIFLKVNTSQPSRIVWKENTYPWFHMPIPAFQPVRFTSMQNRSTIVLKCLRNGMTKSICLEKKAIIWQ